MEHQSQIDRSFVESVFESYSTKVERDQDEIVTNLKRQSENEKESRVISRTNSILAYKDIFKMWKIKLNEEASKKLLNLYFKVAWDKMAENGEIDVKDTYSFIKELMTT